MTNQSIGNEQDPPESRISKPGDARAAAHPARDERSVNRRPPASGDATADSTRESPSPDAGQSIEGENAWSQQPGKPDIKRDRDKPTRAEQ